ncbi:hypothetical protein [Pseudonocardia alaniniphila]|uniref:Uncharacterized protein n=1 Tax=Pseudonocardia alaniniphila TaxID=75291 RepID=A0ABS9TTJ3_9PSEU|nr:hypothetical protein [Pseudonocardia alaniniphila]MCH6171865.1 hypothetical protein [Pseudonocardia alaniniphila]
MTADSTRARAVGIRLVYRYGKDGNSRTTEPVDISRLKERGRPYVGDWLDLVECRDTIRQKPYSKIYVAVADMANACPHVAVPLVPIDGDA